MLREGLSDEMLCEQRLEESERPTYFSIWGQGHGHGEQLVQRPWGREYWARRLGWPEHSELEKNSRR